ncbi:MAG: serine O-acetyltransferase [Clostridia bacterium]|nr:serine O-acetyltransferase [Clostridia bacterium]
MGLIKDIKAVKAKDPAAPSSLGIFFLYPGVHALMWHRVSHFLWKIHLRFIARLISQLTRFFTNIEIHPAAQIGEGLFIDHGSGIVIGETTIIGDNCMLYQGCTLGGTGKDVGKRHPTLGNNVMVGSGAKVLGPCTLGNNVKVAANAVVLHNLPDNCTAVGVPAKIVRIGGQRVEDIDQVNIPDPVAQEICRLEHEIMELKKQIKEIGKQGC